MLASVALPLSIAPLTYSVPKEFSSQLKIGSPVFVPLKKKIISGYVLKLENLSPSADSPYEIKNIIKINPDMPPLDQDLLKFLEWIAHYYHYPAGEVIKAALPSSLVLKTEKLFRVADDVLPLTEEKKLEFSKRGGKRLELLSFLENSGPIKQIPEQWKNVARDLQKNGFISINESPLEPKFIIQNFAIFPASKKQTLSNEQLAALQKIDSAIKKSTYQGFLLEGVTGSGKTEVYLAAAEQVIATGGSVMLLVPEIALTPQLLSRVRAHLGEEIAVFHSGLNEYERTMQWHLINSGKAKIVVGARSTIFTPIKNLKLIIIDEEHETAFKQEDRLRYNARDLSILRAKLANATLILGSATPSLESFYQTIKGNLQYIHLSQRYAGRALPKVEVVDLRTQNKNGSFSMKLINALKNCLNEKRQAMLFINRKGFASFVICDHCGHVPECPNCSVSLTKYQEKSHFLCHHCGFSKIAINKCEICGSGNLSFGGLGTENIELQVRELFPEARTIRIDRESTAKKLELETKLLAVAKNEVDIIIGTQMIAKGHDFPNVKLVAILNADVSMNVPDFRATERSFQLFTQMAGRAGRGEWNGNVILQTFNPQHPSIQFAQNHAFREFAATELEARLQFHYPPYYKMVRILVSDLSDIQAQKSIQKISHDLLQINDNQSKKIEILGPAPAIIKKIQNRYRWSLLLKAKEASQLNTVIKSILPKWRKNIPKSSIIHVDVDPIALL